MGEFVDFDPSRFPQVFECVGCGDELHVSRQEAEDVADATATARDAAETVRRMKGWWKDPSGVKCPDCLKPLPNER